MKKVILIAACSLTAFWASAEIKFRSLDNISGTNVILVDENPPKSVEITDAVLFNNGSKYTAKQIRCDVVNGQATYRLKFKRLTRFNNCKVLLTVNGENLSIDLQKNLSDK